MLTGAGVLVALEAVRELDDSSYERVCVCDCEWTCDCECECVCESPPEATANEVGTGVGRGVTAGVTAGVTVGVTARVTMGFIASPDVTICTEAAREKCGVT